MTYYICKLRDKCSSYLCGNCNVKKEVPITTFIQVNFPKLELEQKHKLTSN